MARSVAAKAAKKNSTEQSGGRARQGTNLSAITGPYSNVLTMQRVAGNQAVSGFLKPTRNNQRFNPSLSQKEPVQAKLISGQTTPTIQRKCAKCQEEETIQPKLKIGAPNDKYEQEADQIADQVIRMPEPKVQRQMGSEEEEEEMLQTKPIAGQISPLIQRQVGAEEEEEEEFIQTKAKFQIQRQEKEEEEPLQKKRASGQSAGITPTINSGIQALQRSSGQSLPPNVQAFMESRFGQKLSNVRFHTSSLAEKLARSIHAKAFTTGRDIVFAKGEFRPETSEGQRLLAHELTHIIQQSAENAIQREPSEETAEPDLTSEEKKELRAAIGTKPILKGWLRRVRNKKVIPGTAKRKRQAQRWARRASRLLLLNKVGKISLSKDEKIKLREFQTNQKFVQIPATKQKQSGKQDTKAGAKQPGKQGTEAETKPAEPKIKVPTLIKGKSVDNPDSLTWDDFKPQPSKPTINNKPVLAVTAVTPKIIGKKKEKRYIAHFEPSSVVWARIHPFNQQDDWVNPTCKKIKNACEKAAKSLPPDKSLVKQFPSGFEWNADLICSDNPSGTANRKIKSSSDCKELFTECSAADPIQLKDALLSHERGHLWIYALASERANDKLTEGVKPSKVTKKLKAVLKKLDTIDYELDTNHACPTLGNTRFWDGNTVRKKVDAEWPK